MLAEHIEIAGAIDVEQGPDYRRPWRLPVADLELHHPRLVTAAIGSSGIRLRFRTAATRLVLDVEPVGVSQPEQFRGGCPPYQLVLDGHPQPVLLAPPHREQVHFDGLPPGAKDVELWLPELSGVRLFDLRAADGAEIRSPRPTHRPRWTVYGSSITHGLLGAPALTWPAVAARQLGRELTNLGYAGECHLDPLVGQMIAEHPAEHITLKLGINVHNWQSQRERAFLPAVHGLVATIRNRQPHTPITVVSPVYSPSRETSGVTHVDRPGISPFTTEGDLSLEQMRDILADIVAVRRRRGDAALHYLDGRELLGKDDVAQLMDGLHPNLEGLQLIGQRYAACSAAWYAW